MGYLLKEYQTSFVLLFCSLLLVFGGCTKKEHVSVGTAASPSSWGQAEPAYPARWDKEVSHRDETPILREKRDQQVFKEYGVNPTISTSTQRFSTFAMDVDSASYRIVRQSLQQGQLPPAAAVRSEEFVNYPDYRYQNGSERFSISAEAVPSPFRPGFHLLHIGIQTQPLTNERRLPANLVLVADISGSMASDEKLELQKKAFTTLVSQLGEQDSVALISYNQDAKTVLQPTSAKYKRKIFKAIKKLSSGGSTNAAGGLRQGYEVATNMAYPGHINRVVLISDGMANVGSVHPDQILEEIADYRKQGIFLTTVGVGQTVYNDYLLEKLANHGNGQYLYFSDQNDINEAFVDGLSAQMQVVAKDAKIQVEFNTQAVQRYRQIGYENRALQQQAFIDGAVDGGEVGAGQQVTALYEVQLTDLRPATDIATVNLSYKRPQGEAVLTLSKPVPANVVAQDLSKVSTDTRVAMAYAAFAEKLKQTYWSRAYSYQSIRQVLANDQAIAADQLVELLVIAEKLDTRSDQFADRYPVEKMQFNQVPLLK